MSARLLDYRSRYKMKSRPTESTSSLALLSPPSLSSSPKGGPLSMPSLPPFQPPPTVAADLWLCRLCGHRTSTELLFQKHLTLAHFKERIIRRIRPPYRCLLCEYLPPAVLTEQETIEGEKRGGEQYRITGTGS